MEVSSWEIRQWYSCLLSLHFTTSLLTSLNLSVGFLGIPISRNCRCPCCEAGSQASSRVGSHTLALATSLRYSKGEKERKKERERETHLCTFLYAVHLLESGLAEEIVTELTKNGFSVLCKDLVCLSKHRAQSFLNDTQTEGSVPRMCYFFPLFSVPLFSVTLFPLSLFSASNNVVEALSGYVWFLSIQPPPTPHESSPSLRSSQ